MSKARWIALAAPLTMLVGALWLTSAIGDLAFQSGLIKDDAYVGLIALPFFFSFVPLLFALIGTRLRFHQSIGVLGKFGLTLSVAGGAGVIGAVLANLLLNGMAPEAGPGPWLNYAAVFALLSIRIGYILFGVDALHYQPLPRWNLLPLLLGSTVVLSLPLEWFGVPAFLHFVITGVCWVLLGLAMMVQRQEPQPLAI